MLAQEARMTKVGRPRKEGIRTASGRLSKKGQGNKLDTFVADLRRQREAWRRVVTDDRLETNLGRLYVDGKLSDIGSVSDRMYAAGKMYFEANAAKDRALDLTMRFPKAQNMTGKALLRDTDEDHAATPAQQMTDEFEDAERKRKTVEKFDKAEAAVGMHSPALRALHSVVIYDLWPDWQTVIHLREALHRLAAHWKVHA